MKANGIRVGVGLPAVLLAAFLCAHLFANPCEMVKLLAPGGAPDDEFGAGVAIDGMVDNPAYVIALPPPCPWDCDGSGDGQVSVTDFLSILAQWGQVGAPCDFDNDGVGVVDFLALLGHWGPCP